MVTIVVHQGGHTRLAERIDPVWLQPGAGVAMWVDLSAPSDPEFRLLADVFHFHELAIEDARASTHHPKVEEYPGFLYLILHGIDFHASRHHFATHDVDFFLGPTFLVTVHSGKSRSVARMREVCPRNGFALADGPAGLMHRIVDGLVDNYQPEVEKIERRIDEVEALVVSGGRREVMREIIALKKDVSALRRITLPQRDVVGRLARREFGAVSENVAYRFRDVHDHLVRLADEAINLQERLAMLLDAHLNFVSNRLNAVMKVLTVIATIFMPLTVLTGLYGMNVRIPQLPGGDRMQFWWIVGIMTVISGVMLWLFRKRRWL
jgi:magnesium transporter